MGMRRVLLNVAGVTLLSSCMASGVGPAGRFSGSEAVRPLQYAEAATGDLTIALSFPTPSVGSQVAIAARLNVADRPQELIEGEMWLHVQAPSGSVEEVRMQRSQGSGPATYQAVYDFWAPGSYVVTARAWTEGDVGTEASVTTSVVVAGDPLHVDHRDWMMPMAVLGGVGMVVMMAVMMSN